MSKEPNNMRRKPKSDTAAASSSETSKRKEPTVSNATAHELFMKAISGNPRFRPRVLEQFGPPPGVRGSTHSRAQSIRI